jgi:spore coat polysaccharide biosynthesis predicted glycosyltransferase SpsG
MDWLSHQDKLQDLLKDSGLVIIDSYLAPKRFYYDLYRRVSSNGGLLAMIDDYSRIDYPAGVVINPSVYAESLRYRSNKAGSQHYLLGAKYIILRDEFVKMPKKEIRQEIKEVLVTLGGMDRTSFMRKLLCRLVKELPAARFHIISSKNMAGSILSLSPRAKFYSGLKALKVRALMLESDICISAGGQTLYELARAGTPSIGICFAQNQKRNLEGLSKTGSLEYAGWFDHPAILERVTRCVRKLMPQQERSARSSSGKMIVDGLGAQRIGDYLLTKSRQNP